MSPQLGWMLVLAGILLLATGLIGIFVPNVPWLGRLPGDFRVETAGMRVYIPITTCTVLSVLISADLWIVRRFSH